MNILLSEDDELILRTIEHHLKKHGYNVLITRNGKEAITMLENEHVDLIITDIMMPFATGIEILSSVKAVGKKIPIIMLSSLGQEDVVLEAFNLGATDFIVKPFSPAELLVRIKRFVP